MLKTAKTRTEKIIYSVVIVLAAIAFPLYFLSKYGEITIKFTPMSILVGSLYIIFITGFIFTVFNKEGPQITSEATDKRISSAWAKIEKIILYGLIVFIIYQAAILVYDYAL